MSNSRDWKLQLLFFKRRAIRAEGERALMGKEQTPLAVRLSVLR